MTHLLTSKSSWTHEWKILSIEGVRYQGLVYELVGGRVGL